MDIKAIVYTSNTGMTREYAELLSGKTGLDLYSLDEAKRKLENNSPIIYFGWLMAGSVVGYRAAAKRYDIRAVCGVGLGDTGAQDGAVRAHERIPDGIVVFTLQGGMDRDKLKGLYKSMINTLTRFMQKKKDRTPDEDRMLELLISGGHFVSEDNLARVLAWYEKGIKE